MIKALPKAPLKSQQVNTCISLGMNQNSAVPLHRRDSAEVKTELLSPVMLPLSQAPWEPGFLMTGALLFIL